MDKNKKMYAFECSNNNNNNKKDYFLKVAKMKFRTGNIIKPEVIDGFDLNLEPMCTIRTIENSRLKKKK